MVSEMTAAELAARWQSGSKPYVLDVRESWERDIARLADTIPMPMNEIPDRLDEIPRNCEIVVMCKSGGRSLRVAQFLLQQGFSPVANLTGGILEWSASVDPSVPTY